MLLVAGILNLFSSYFIASVVGNFLALYVAFFALIILNIEILSLLNGIYDYNILIFSFLNLIFSFLFFRYKKAVFLKPAVDFKKILNALLLDKSLFCLFFVFLILIIVSGILAYVMPPLEPDAQTYHFYRAYMFYENHNLKHFDTNDARALIMPINSEIVYTWILALKHKLYNFALLSYFSYFAIIAGIWQILSYLKFSVRKKIFAIFVFSSLASVVIEMSCLQTDIVVGALYICAFSLFLHKKNYLSALSVAIALGIKSTAFVLLIPYLLMIFLLNRKCLLRYILYLALNFIVFSSYNYILNFIQYGNFVTNNAAFLGHKFWGGIRGYVANLLNFAFQFFDFTGFTWGYYINAKAYVLRNAFFHFIHISPDIGSNVIQEHLNISTDEQVASFGILGFLALIPSVFKGFFSRKKIIFLLSCAFILNILILARMMAYMEYSIRFILSFACFSAPLLALFYFKKGFYKFIVCMFCAFYMGILPIHIRRAPFFIISPYLVKNHYNLDKFVEDGFNGKIVEIWGMTPAIKNLILEKYPNAKKIGYFKTTESSALYLKTIFDIDFLDTSKISKYNLDKYDLLIFESEVQDSNTFKHAEINYKMLGKIVQFKEKGQLDCFCADKAKVVVFDEKLCSKQYCFGKQYFDRNKQFKLDYTLKYSDKDISERKIYFYIKLN